MGVFYLVGLERSWVQVMVYAVKSRILVSGLGFASITGKSKSLIAMINGALGTLFALWLYNNFVGWLGLLSSALPPVGAILLADYFLVLCFRAY